MWDSIIVFFEANGWRWVTFMAVLVAGVILVRALCYALRKILSKGKLERTITGFIVTVVRFVLYLVLVFILAGVAGIDLSPLSAAVSAALVAIGLALQNSLSNLANGVILISTKPFIEGDYVEIGGTGGTVKNVGMFMTELITPDSKKIVMSNSAVMEATIVNFSERATRRVDFNITVDYDSDVEHVKSVIKGVADKHPKVLADPEPVIRLHGFKDNGLNFIARVWVNNADYWGVYWDINEQVFAAFKENGIRIPVTRLDVRMKKGDE